MDINKKSFSALFLVFFLTFSFLPTTGVSREHQNSNQAQDTPLPLPAGKIQKEERDTTKNDLINAVRAGKSPIIETKVEIIKMLFAVKHGNITPEMFYQKLSTLEMEPGKELRHTLMEVKKDVGNYLGKNGLTHYFGEIHDSGGTRVEAEILTHRKKVVMDTIKKAIGVYAKKHKNPKVTFYYGEVGGWPTESFEELKFAGDIDFNFLAGDLDAAMELKVIFDDLIKERYKGRTPEDLDIPCTVHGMATSEVYVDYHGQGFAERVTKVLRKITFGENGGEPGVIMDKEIPFKEALRTMLMEAEVPTVSNKLADLKKMNWPEEPGITLEMIRHFEHDITGQNVYTDLESFVKAAKYADRSFTALTDDLGESAIKDPILRKLTTDLTENKENPKKQVQLIDEYYKDIGKPLPFEVHLGINDDGKTRATLETNEKLIKNFWDVVRQTMWESANVKVKKTTIDFNKKISALGDNDVEGAKAIYEELKKYQRMLEVEDILLNDKRAGVHGHIDPDFKKNLSKFRKTVTTFKQKVAKNNLLKYIDPQQAKSFKWIETMLKAGTKFNVKMAVGALKGAPGKLNDILDILDDTMLNKLRNGESEQYIKILRKGEGYYWGEQADQFLKNTRFEGRYTEQINELQKDPLKPLGNFGAKIKQLRADFDTQLLITSKRLNDHLAGKLASRGIKMMRSAGGGTLQGIQTVNKSFNESVAASAAGQKMMTGMMIYSLKDELPLYMDLMMKDDYGGLASEFFKRRVPFGGAVERAVMGECYGVLWEVTASLIPPLGIMAAAKDVGASIAVTGIEAIWSEELETLIDNLYDKADFEIVGAETVGDNIKISEWQLRNITYKSKKFNIDELIAKEMEDAREMDACLPKTSQEIVECFPIEKVSDGLFEMGRNQSAFENKFEKTDPWIQLILEMEKNEYAGKKLKQYFRYQKYTRWEQIKVEFLKHTKVKLEERKAGEQSLLSGNFPKMHDELLKIADELDIRPQIDQRMADEFGSDVMLYMTSFKDFLRGVVRELKGEVDVWDVYEELSAYVTKNLRVYKEIRESREKAEQYLNYTKQDQGLRTLTGPYFLNGNKSQDTSSSDRWGGLPAKVKEQMSAKLSGIKRETEADPVDLDLDDGSYDLSILEQLIYHDSFTEMWIWVNGQYNEDKVPSYLGRTSSTQKEKNDEGVISDSDRAMQRFTLHTKRVKEIIAAFKKHYESEAEKETQLKDLQNILTEMQSIEEQIENLHLQILALIDHINSLGGSLAEQLNQATRLLDAIQSVQSGKDNSMRVDDTFLGNIPDIEKISIRIADIRNTIESETLKVCKTYQQIQETDKTRKLDKIIDVTRSSYKNVDEYFAAYLENRKQLKTVKEKLKQMEQKQQMFQEVKKKEQQLQEAAKMLKTQTESSRKLGSLMDAIMDKQQNATSLHKEAIALMQELEGIHPEDLSKKNNKNLQLIRGLNINILRYMTEISAAESKINQDILFDETQIAELELRLHKLQEQAEKQTVTTSGKSFAEVQKSIIKIRTRIDAAEIFFVPIDEAYKNAKICFDGSEKIYGRKASNEKREAETNCDDFQGTQAQWHEDTQDVRCDCIDPEKRYNRTMGRCISLEEFEVAKADCSKWNATAIWDRANQRAVCDCVGDYQWNNAETTCIKKPQLQVAGTRCSKWLNSTPVWNQEKERVECDCVGSYEWDAPNDDKCRIKKEIQLAEFNCEQWPNSTPVWNNTTQSPHCVCEKDYELNEDRNACRVKKRIQVDEANCNGFPGTHAEWSERHNGVRCVCDSGSWSSSQKRCLSAREQALAELNCGSCEAPYYDKSKREAICVCASGCGYDATISDYCIPQEEIARVQQQRTWDQEAQEERRRKERDDDRRWQQEQYEKYKRLAEQGKQKNTRDPDKPNWDNGCNSSGTGGATYRGSLRDPPPYTGSNPICSDRDGVTWFVGAKVLSLNKGGPQDQNGCYPKASLTTTLETYKGKICLAR
jgi:hypothetical protein